MGDVLQGDYSNVAGYGSQVGRRGQATAEVSSSRDYYDLRSGELKREGGSYVVGSSAAEARQMAKDADPQVNPKTGQTEFTSRASYGYQYGSPGQASLANAQSNLEVVKVAPVVDQRPTLYAYPAGSAQAAVARAQPGQSITVGRPPSEYYVYQPGKQTRTDIQRVQDIRQTVFGKGRVIKEEPRTIPYQPGEQFAESIAPSWIGSGFKRAGQIVDYGFYGLPKIDSEPFGSFLATRSTNLAVGGAAIVGSTIEDPLGTPGRLVSGGWNFFTKDVPSLAVRGASGQPILGKAIDTAAQAYYGGKAFGKVGEARLPKLAVETWASGEARPMVGFRTPKTLGYKEFEVNQPKASPLVKALGGYQEMPVAEPVYSSRVGLSWSKTNLGEFVGGLVPLGVETVRVTTRPSYWDVVMNKGEGQVKPVFTGVYYKGFESLGKPAMKLLVGAGEKGGVVLGQPLPSVMPSLAKAKFLEFSTGNPDVPAIPKTSFETKILTEPSAMKAMGFSSADISLTKGYLESAETLGKVRTQILNQFPSEAKTARAPLWKAVIEELEPYSRRGTGEIDYLGGSTSHYIQAGGGRVRGVGDIEPYLREDVSYARGSEIIGNVVKRLKERGFGDEIIYKEGSVKITGYTSEGLAKLKKGEQINPKPGAGDVDHFVDTQLHKTPKLGSGSETLEPIRYGYKTVGGNHYKYGPFDIKSVTEQLYAKGGSALGRYEYNNRAFLSPAAHRIKDIVDTKYLLDELREQGTRENQLTPEEYGKTYDYSRQWRQHKWPTEIAEKVGGIKAVKLEETYAEYEKNIGEYKKNYPGELAVKIPLSETELFQAAGYAPKIAPAQTIPLIVTRGRAVLQESRSLSEPKKITEYSVKDAGGYASPYGRLPSRNYYALPTDGKYSLKGYAAKQYGGGYHIGGYGGVRGYAGGKYGSGYGGGYGGSGYGGGGSGYKSGYGTGKYGGYAGGYGGSGYGGGKYGGGYGGGYGEGYGGGRSGGSKIIPPVAPPITFRGMESTGIKKKSEKGFLVIGRKAGKEIVLNSRPLVKEEALSFGQRFLGLGSQRTIRLRPFGTAERGRFSVRQLREQLYTPKTIKPMQAGEEVFTQKPKFSIFTAAEKMALKTARALKGGK